MPWHCVTNLTICRFTSWRYWYFLAKSALTQIEQSSEAGKGIASAGLVCSVIGIVLQLLLIIGGLSLVFFSIE